MWQRKDVTAETQLLFLYRRRFLLQILLWRHRCSYESTLNPARLDAWERLCEWEDRVERVCISSTQASHYACYQWYCQKQVQQNIKTLTNSTSQNARYNLCTKHFCLWLWEHISSSAHHPVRRYVFNFYFNIILVIVLVHLNALLYLVHKFVCI